MKINRKILFSGVVILGFVCHTQVLGEPHWVLTDGLLIHGLIPGQLNSGNAANSELILHNVKQVARLTGKTLPGEKLPNPNHTDRNYDVGGTDLGIMWAMDQGKIGIVFGDTYGSRFVPQPGGGPTGGPAGTPEGSTTVDHWRSNVLAFSTDHDLDDGLTFSSMIVSEDRKAIEVIPSTHDQSGKGDYTTIPTAAVRVNQVDYIHYMSIRKWGTTKGWDTNFSSLFSSTDDGMSWKRCTEVTFSSNSPFSQVCYALKGDSVYMIGTPSGRSGSAYLARFLKDEILDVSQYDYWNTKQGWVRNKEAAATVLFDAPVGELSLMYHEKYKRWIVTYFDSDQYAIVYRDASDASGQWSEEKILVSGNDYPQLYGSYLHPLKCSDDSIYFLMSMWRPYNVFLMKADLKMNGLNY